MGGRRHVLVRSAAIIAVASSALLPPLLGAPARSAVASAGPTAVTTLISVTPSGEPADRLSGSPDISGDGRYVVFASKATDLVTGDRNRVSDIFIRDLKLSSTELVSIGSRGRQANNESWEPAVSADGRYVAFTSRATNLVRGVRFGAGHPQNIYVRDLRAGTTELVSVTLDGSSAGDSERPVISADGSLVGFSSESPDLVEDDIHEFEPDVFLRDLDSDSTRLVGVGPSGTQVREAAIGTSISANGRYLAFYTVPTDKLFVFDRRKGRSRGLRARDGKPIRGSEPAISGDGTRVAFAAGRRGVAVRLHDLATKATERIGPGTISDLDRRGRYVVFSSDRGPLVAGLPDGVHAYRRDSKTGAIIALDTAHPELGVSGFGPTISDDGRIASFVGGPKDRPVYKDRHVFVRGPLD